MSLIGSLEDLSLGDILQIISLSQKSGVLVLRTDEGEGRIVLRAGLVSGAATKGGPNELRDVLVGGGFVSDEAYSEAVAAVDDGEQGLDELLCAGGSLSPERLESLRRESVEGAVIEMFRWASGEFSFDVREVLDAEDPQISLETGVNPQYLAMEAARCDDESGRGAEGDADTDVPEMSAHEMFGVAPEPEPETEAELGPDAGASDPGSESFDAGIEAAAAELDSDEESRRLAVEALADAARRSAAPSELDVADDPAAALDASRVAADATVPEIELVEALETAQETASSAVEPDDDEPGSAFDPSRPVVVIDGELAALEWTKSALSDTFERIHIFQRSEIGLARIRQYLSRAIAPIVLISPDTPGDRLSGIRDASDFVRRLKQQASRTHVVWLQEDGARPIEAVEPADSVAVRPASHHLRNESAREQVQSLSASLVEQLCATGSGEAASGAPKPAAAPGQDLESLKRVTQHLRDASTRGEVLPLVIDFAATHFRRVAMWMVRDGVAVGMAQRGLELCGGPGDDALRELQVPAEQSPTLSSVLAQRAPVVCTPDASSDNLLPMALGDRLPKHFYLAPIESAGHVVAVIYGDDLPGGAEPGDTSALEVVLHHAGLALDRASLERALAEAESDLTG